MKSFLFSSLVLLLGALFIIPSCKKADEKSQKTTPVVSQMTDIERINSIKNDPDWKVIAGNNAAILEKFITKKVDLNKFDFNNQEEFLKIAGMDKSTYLNIVKENKSAANRLILKFKFSTSSNPKCVSCSENINSTIYTLRGNISKFQQNPFEFQRFKQNSLGIANNVVGGVTPDVAKPCCPVQFYECVVVCAATIEFFPVYLICAAGCYGGFCCGQGP